jgi:hypothetical protein
VQTRGVFDSDTVARQAPKEEMADGMSSGRSRFDDRDASPSTTRSSALGRVPTWARNINFDTSFDLRNQASPENSGYVSPSDGLTGLALGGSPQLSDQQALPTSGSWGRGGAFAYLNVPYAKLLTYLPLLSFHRDQCFASLSKSQCRNFSAAPSQQSSRSSAQRQCSSHPFNELA